MDVETFTGRIAEGGGGLDAAKEVVGDLPESRRRVRDQWDTERLRETFQALYLGEELYRELEGRRPRCRRRGTSTTSRPWWSRRRSLT